MDAPRIVVERVSPSHRRYHVNTAFGCELEHGIFSERLDEMMRKTHPQSLDEAGQLIGKFLQEHSPGCSLEAALNTLEYCVHGHDGAVGIVDITINLARANWSVIQKRVITVIKANLAWNEYVELQVV